MSTSDVPRGRGLFEIRSAGDRAVTNIRRLAGTESGATPGRGLINTAAILLALLGAGLFAVSLAAQYQYIFHAKHQHWPALIEAVALDAGMLIFSLLALGLARSGQSARIERILIMICSAGSAGMNYAAADITSPRSVLAYTMPPVFLAIVADRVIAVVRRHVLGMTERSAWAGPGRAATTVARVTGLAGLYTLRLILAPPQTALGLRRAVLDAAPLPGIEPGPRPQAIEAGAYPAATPVTGGMLATALESARDTIRTELAASQAPAAVTAGQLAEGLESVRESLRTGLASVHETIRTELASVQPPPAGGDGSGPAVPGRDALIAELADEIRDAISSGEQWSPDYTALHERTGKSRSFHEKAVREARTQAFTTPYDPRTGEAPRPDGITGGTPS